MITLSRISFIVLIFTASFLIAKTISTQQINRSANKIESSPIKLRIVYGEKTTNFIITKIKTEGLVNYSNSLGIKSSKTISIADYSYLKSKIEDISGPSNKKYYCPRNYIEVNGLSRELIGCLGAANKVARDLQETANLISILF